MNDRDHLRKVIWIATCNLYRTTISPASDKFLVAAFQALKAEKKPIPEGHILALRKEMRRLSTGDMVVDLAAGDHKDAIGTFVDYGMDAEGKYCAVQVPAGHIVRWRDRNTIKVLTEVVWISD